MAGSLLQTALGSEPSPAPDERRGGAAAAHRACYSTPSTRGLDIVLSGRFVDPSLDFRSESGPRRRGRLCPQPRVSEHQREQYIPRRLVKIFSSTNGAWGVRPRPDGTAPGVRRAAAALAGSRPASGPRKRPAGAPRPPTERPPPRLPPRKRAFRNGNRPYPLRLERSASHTHISAVAKQVRKRVAIATPDRSTRSPAPTHPLHPLHSFAR